VADLYSILLINHSNKTVKLILIITKRSEPQSGAPSGAMLESSYLITLLVDKSLRDQQRQRLN
jgi:hypothetical protein